ncbi:miniconductance mechanosensitive channel [Rubritalea squalenifaciens DSM 18772]|uniref:Mechanosensing system component YbdG n=1 Tax=Rubritalea squalenifaciens DSM 18772 TaxID=1123071 RepID=A0A1M6R320_9BACT|nr:mechanosensitive ion channel family protein [Rubritalea squalenifaciens]SHK26823.1 miniconductance mechanosensitive channel [Rubritalea squalenifaciens DSM 18772]
MENKWHHQLRELFFGEVQKVEYTNEQGVEYIANETISLPAQLAVDGVLFLGLLLVSFVIYLVVKRVVFRVVEKLVHATNTDWDDEFLRSRIFRWIALVVPTVIIWKYVGDVFNPIAFGLESKTNSIIYVRDGIVVVAKILTVVFSMLCFNSILNTGERIYMRFEVSKKLPMKSFLQVLKIILVLIGIILIVASIMGESPMLIFSGLGAATAILMLIFKDAILGLVAGVQLSANQMVTPGDWIEMPKFGADGEVMEVALTTVKVRNWDMTISTVPTYALISDSFKNWRGMSESGVRRIKRSLNFDMQSVTFLNKDMMAKMREISLLKGYLEKKEKEIAAWNAEKKAHEDDLINARAMTNIGTFRAYVWEYLTNHPGIDEKHTILVRQLQPGENGLPIEVYAFTNNNAWVAYEGIQSDIFDHLISVSKFFGLRIFQRPSGMDFDRFKHTL